MALKKHSIFYYGHKIDENNNRIDFADSPGGPEKTAEIPVGSYTLTKFLEVITAAMNAASSLDWTFTLDRTTRIVSFQSSAAADLLLGTGTNFLNTPAALLGFPQADILNDTSFVGSSASGFEWAPQFPLQDYKPKDKNKKLVNAVVTKSASGDNVSVQSFGVDRFIKMNAKYITNQPTEGVLRNNPDAVAEVEAFLDYIVEKNPVEFMEDEEDRDTFDKVYLESTPQSSDGTQYDLIEYVDRNLPEYFETGLLTFKVINKE
jgi:hypothetical protein